MSNFNIKFIIFSTTSLLAFSSTSLLAQEIPASVAAAVAGATAATAAENSRAATITAAAINADKYAVTASAMAAKVKAASDAATLTTTQNTALLNRLSGATPAISTAAQRAADRAARDALNLQKLVDADPDVVAANTALNSANAAAVAAATKLAASATAAKTAISTYNTNVTAQKTALAPNTLGANWNPTNMTAWAAKRQAVLNYFNALTTGDLCSKATGSDATTLVVAMRAIEKGAMATAYQGYLQSNQTTTLNAQANTIAAQWDANATAIEASIARVLKLNHSDKFKDAATLLRSDNI